MINNKLSELEDIESSNHFKLLVEECEKRGFIQYEISNFGKKNFFSTHNSNYWVGSEFLGIGPSAHSYNGKVEVGIFLTIQNIYIQ